MLNVSAFVFYFCFSTHQICVKNPTIFIQKITFLSSEKMSGLQQKQTFERIFTFNMDLT